MLAPIVILVGLAALCNLTVLAAIAAGRRGPGGGRRAYLAAQAALLAIALVVALLTGATAGRTSTGPGAFLGLLALAMGFLLGGGLTYLEYAALGRARNFRADLGGSLWVGRLGIRRLDGKQ